MVDPLTVGGVGALSAMGAGGSGLSLSAIGNILGGAGMAAGGIGGLFSGSRGGTPDTSTFFQNWRNDDMAWAREQFQRNEDLQREFAQNGVRWRVADTVAAGLHPLAALGASGSMYSPSTTAFNSYNVDHGRPGIGPDIGASLSQMGQGVSRAMSAAMTKSERATTAFEVARQAQQLEQGDLQNQLLRSQLYRMNYNSPAMPGGPSNAPLQTAGQPVPIGGTSGPVAYDNEYRVLKSTTGGYVTHPSEFSKAEDEFGAPLGTEFLVRNRLFPMLGSTPPKAITDAARRDGFNGAYWDYLKGEWHGTTDRSGKGALHRYFDWRRDADQYRVPEAPLPEGWRPKSNNPFQVYWGHNR